MGPDENGTAPQSGGNSNADLEAAICAAESNPDAILKARMLMEQLGPSLSNSERVEAYRRLAAAPNYRNQRDNKQNPSSTCNMTSQAMAFEALGLNFHEDERGLQGEEQLLDRLDEAELGARTDPAARLRLARDQGLEAAQIAIPELASAAAAHNWFKKHLMPQLESGSSATMGIAKGSFKHVVRVQWIDDDGIVVDDPWGEPLGMGKKFGYERLNPKAGDEKILDEDQEGYGDDRKIPWKIAAQICSGRYVQVYQASPTQLSDSGGADTPKLA